MSRRFYSGSPSFSSEPSLRDEFNNTMDGLVPEIAKGQTFVLRKMKRVSGDPIITDPNDPDYDEVMVRKFHAREQIDDFYVPGQGYLLPCTCVSLETSEPDVDNYCPICMNEGYIWDETFIKLYKVVANGNLAGAELAQLQAAGLTNIPLVVFYTRSSVLITRADKVVEIWTDEDGEPIRPYRRKAIYRIGTSIEYRSDNGRIEYRELDTFEEKRKYLNGPKVG